MTEKEMCILFEEISEEYYSADFEDVVTNKRSKRPDLHAFLLLDELIPGRTRDIVAAASHDEIFLDVNLEELAAVITAEQIKELSCCGVRCIRYEGLRMFA